MRVALIVPRFPVLSETFIISLVSGLLHREIDVQVIVHHRDDDADLLANHLDSRIHSRKTLSPLAPWPSRIKSVAEQISSSPLRAVGLLHRSNKAYGHGPRSVRAWLLGLPLITTDFDVIHFSFSGLAITYLDVIPLLQGKKIIVSCRGAAEQITPLVDPHRKLQLEHVFAYAHTIHCVTEDMTKTVMRYGAHWDKVMVNRPAVDAASFRRSSPYPRKDSGPYHALSVSRLHWKKGLDFALLAIRHLIDRGHDIVYTIIGGGPEEERIRFTIQDLALDERVLLLGRQPPSKVRDVMERADVFLLPSLSEGLSNAVLEAMAYEVPVVATTAGGMAEAISDGLEGFLTPPRDATSMADRIAELLTAPDRRLAMGAAARRRVHSEFNLDDQISRFIQIYRFR